VLNYYCCIWKKICIIKVKKNYKSWNIYWNCTVVK